MTSFSQTRALFIRGGAGTVGFFEGGADEQGASIFNKATNGGNHGWGELAAALRAEGFQLEEATEDPVAATSPFRTPTPVPLEAMDLSVYDVIVFGSNNAEYVGAQVDALLSYVNDGGAALFISDANFGQFWGDAPSSDQAFLERIGWEMNQDQGTYALSRSGGDFLVPNHPILDGVASFDGEGVSPITLVDDDVLLEIDGLQVPVRSQILTRAKGSVRRNTGDSQGPSSQDTAADGTLLVAEIGAGRIAGHFDRNTFFNLNGAGTNIRRLSNEVYARNLFNWLVDDAFVGAPENYAPRVQFNTLRNGQSLLEGQSLNISTTAIDPDGSVQSVALEVDGSLVSSLTAAPYNFSINSLAAGERLLSAVVTDDDGAVTRVSIQVDVLSAAGQEQLLDPSAWTVTASQRQSDVGSAYDSNPSSRWATGTPQRPGMFFTVDLGERQTVSRIVLDSSANPNDYPRGFVVAGSNDGVSYTELESEAGNGAVTVIPIEPLRTYRYYRITQTGSSPVNWWSIHEMQVFVAPTNAVLSQDEFLQRAFGDDFGVAALEDEVWGDLADPDRDGLENLLEFALGLDPLRADRGVETSSFRSDSGETVIESTFRRWREENGIRYVPEWSSDLSSWLRTGFMQVGEAQDNADGTETVVVQRVMNGTSGFGRLRIFKE